jgi:hypothetical protein
MSDDEDVAALMSSLRGDYLNQDDFAAAGQQIRLLNSNTEAFSVATGLPLTYDVKAISDFWSIRPVSVVSRILQLGAISADFLVRVLWDVFTGRLQENQVRRAIQIRNIVTSLGPAYIKVWPSLFATKSICVLERVWLQVHAWYSAQMYNWNQSHTHRSAAPHSHHSIDTHPVAQASRLQTLSCPRLFLRLSQHHLHLPSFLSCAADMTISLVFAARPGTLHPPRHSLPGSHG